MKDVSVKNAYQIRRQHNSELIRKMRNGESLTSFDSKASWYPPRPVIEKDKREMARLYDPSMSPGEFHRAGGPASPSDDSPRKLAVVSPDQR